jgi:thiopeptide-type bacteriocin biosynthesis protein
VGSAAARLGFSAPTLDPSAPVDSHQASFFVVRTPLLSWDELESWAADLEAPAVAGQEAALLEAAVARDRVRLTARLQDIAVRPEVREAMFLASPDLEDSLQIWLNDSASERGARIGRSVLRYFIRMCARATPFGLFAASEMGEILTGRGTCLEIASRTLVRRHTRLDMEFLCAVSDALAREPAVRPALRFRPNDSLYEAAGRLRYVEWRMDGKARAHRLVALEPTPYLESTLARAADGAALADLARALTDEDVDIEEARGYVEELAESQVLVPELAPAVTGPDPLSGLLSLLRASSSTGQAAAARLETAATSLDALDRAGPGVDPGQYRALAQGLSALPAEPDLARLFQVDLVRTGSALGLSASVVDEITRGVELLRTIVGRRSNDALARFREAFVQRYEGREVPLLEALDEETGIGFEASRSPGAEASPLLEGVDLPDRASEPRDPWSDAQRALLLARAEHARWGGGTEIRLDASDLRSLAARTPAPLPDAFAAMVTLAAATAHEVERGEFRILMHGVSGPSGARLLGRFCCGDDALARRVAEHLRAEERCSSGAIFAEIVHLPEGRIGNVICRPVLRGHEIAYLGASGVAPEHRIPASDLRVRVISDRIVLRSERLGREVVPRLTSAHNFTWRSLGPYRFLCSLQDQDAPGSLGWQWGSLESAPFLPRVSAGRVVLARAQWRVGPGELEPLVRLHGASLFRAARAWRAERGIPRLVAVADADNVLPFDLENILALEAFLHLADRKERVFLLEVFPGPGELVARGAEGRFVHELVVPFVRATPASPPIRTPTAPPTRRAAAHPGLPRTIVPGGECLYVALYTGSSTCDLILRELVAPFVDEALASKRARQWFFVRYADPAWHVRLRLFGTPSCLWGELFPELERRSREFLDRGMLSRISVLTYEREVERYGGEAGLVLAERIFHADSEAVLAIVRTLSGDQGADARWRLALRGMDWLLEDLGLSIAQRLDLARRLGSGLRAGVESDRAFAIQLGAKFRRERAEVEELWDMASRSDHWLAPGLAAFERRSAALRTLAEELRALERSHDLSVPIEELAASFLHMHANRMLRSAHAAQELVLYDFLRRSYESRIQRGTPRR